MRIGINVPNDLLKKVKAIQPELNVSQICRDALEEYVRRDERVAAQVAADDVEQHLARIGESGQFSLMEPDWEGLALEDARNWIAKATKEDWDRYLDIRHSLERLGREDETWFARVHGINEVKRFPNREEEHKEWLLAQYEYDLESRAGSEAEERYNGTFMSYLEKVRQVWEQRRKEKLEGVMAERILKRKALGAPTLPPMVEP